ncbi:hypothetical protein [Streptomyces sp. NPDC003668]
MPQLDKTVGLMIGDDASFSSELGSFTNDATLHVQHGFYKLVF